MPKTCRTCTEANPILDCYYQGTLSGDCAELCPYYMQRETPLLIDELAEAVKELLVIRFAFDPQLAVVRERGRTVLARYQKEVCDAQD